MNNIVAIAAALLPPALLWLYIWKRDPVKEPKGQLVKAVLYGLCICIPVSLIEVGIQQSILGGEDPETWWESTIVAFFVAALPEESVKLLALWLLLRRNPWFDEHFDGIVYAVCVGLGFAAVENVFYVLDEDGEWMSVAVARALLAVPAHYAFAVIMGYYYSVYHFVDRSPRIAACILFVPFMAHGIYDAIAFSSAINPYLGGIGTLVLIGFCIKMHKFAKTKVLALIEKDSNGIQDETISHA